eukprot:1138961-Pelagomonas_calceolata.AAC.10
MSIRESHPGTLGHQKHGRCSCTAHFGLFCLMALLRPGEPGSLSQGPERIRDMEETSPQPNLCTCGCAHAHAHACAPTHTHSHLNQRLLMLHAGNKAHAKHTASTHTDTAHVHMPRALVHTVAQATTVAADSCLKLVEARTSAVPAASGVKGLWRDASLAVARLFPRFDVLDAHNPIITSSECGCDWRLGCWKCALLLARGFPPETLQPSPPPKSLLPPQPKLSRASSSSAVTMSDDCGVGDHEGGIGTSWHGCNLSGSSCTAANASRCFKR